MTKAKKDTPALAGQSEPGEYDPYSPRVPEKAANDTPPPANSELTPGEVKALKMHHFRAVQAQRERVDEQQTEYKRLRKLAKADGIVLSDLDFMMKCAEIEDPTILTDRAKREAEIMQWFALPVQFQADMFEAGREPAEDRAGREGEAAGFAGKSDESPYEPNSPMGRSWSAGWRRAQDQMLADLETAMLKRNAVKDELIKGDDGDDPFEDEFDAADPAKVAAE